MKKTSVVALVAALASTLAIASCSSGGTGGTTGTGGATGAGGGDAGVNTASVARGQYLVDHLLVCGECHTPVDASGKPDKTKYLAGSRSYDFKAMNGDIVSV